MEKEPTLRVRNGKKKKAHKYILSVSLVTDTSIYIYICCLERHVGVYRVVFKRDSINDKEKKKSPPQL